MHKMERMMAAMPKRTGTMAEKRMIANLAVTMRLEGCEE